MELTQKGWIVKLTVLERLLLLQVLPQRGSFTTLRIVRQLQNDLSFSEDEHRMFGIVDEGGATKWDEAAATEKDVEFGPKALDVVRGSLEALERDGVQFPMAMLDVCDKVGYEGLLDDESDT